MVIKFLFLLLLIGFSLYGEGSCEKLFADATLFHDANELDDTDRYLGYIGDLLDRKIIGETHLKKVLEGLRNGELLNPISENEVVSSSSKMKHMGIHRDGLQEYLDEDNLDQKRVKDFVTRNLKNEKNVRIKRNNTRKETKELFKKMEFATISPGIIELGEGRKEFEVEITKPFEIMRTLITQHMWVDVMGENPSKFKDGPDSISIKINGRFIRMQPEHPVDSISFKDIQKFIKKLNVKNDGYIYRLPTEAEWEYVARNKVEIKDIYYFGANPKTMPQYGWFEKNSNETTHPVCEFDPLIVEGNEIFDLYGNVWEWVEDGYGTYPKGKKKDYRGCENTSFHVLRGGSWKTSYVPLVSSGRRSGYFSLSESDYGFRLVRVKNQSE